MRLAVSGVASNKYKQGKWADLYLIVAIIYLVLDVVSYFKIINYGLFEFAHPVRLYYPFYSDFFSAESVMMYMVIIAAALANYLQPEEYDHHNARFAENLAMFFAVAAVPVRFMTNGWLIYETAFYAFIMFFSTILLYCIGWLEFFAADGLKPNKVAALTGLLAVIFLWFQPWFSPEQKLKKAIAANDSAGFKKLAQSYPQHLRMSPVLLNAACKSPDMEIFQTILEGGNLDLSPNYMNQEIFAEKNLPVLKRLGEKGINIASMSFLRSAVEYYARRFNHKQRSNDRATKDYPVLKYLIEQHRQASAEKKEIKDSYPGLTGFSNIVSIAASRGDAALVEFLLAEGFTIDEDVIQAVSLGKALDNPEIQKLRSKSPFFNNPAASSTVQPAINSATDAIGSASATAPAHESHQATPMQQLTKPAQNNAKPFPYQPVQSPDGLDLILTSGSDIKRHRDRQDNIFHFLAERWYVREYSNSFNNINFENIFRAAISRKININQKNSNGDTPLWLALYANNLRAFSSFISNGADITATNSESLTMLEYCEKNNRKIFAEALKK
jgi:hypothetical protein